MCAILDSAVAHEVFGHDRPDAGKGFRRWLESEKGQLVIGGRLRGELARNHAFRPWLAEALRAGRARSLNDAEVDKRETALGQSGYVNPTISTSSPWRNSATPAFCTRMTMRLLGISERSNLSTVQGARCIPRNSVENSPRAADDSCSVEICVMPASRERPHPKSYCSRSTIWKMSSMEPS